MSAIRALKRTANAVARTTLSPLPLAFWERTFPKDVIALCYHVVSDVDLPHLALYPYKNGAQFEADVRFAIGRTLTYREVVERRLRGVDIDPNRILFTFDDGLASCHDVIAPVLKRHAVDGVFFVTTDYLDDREPFFECLLSLCLSAIVTLSDDRAREILAALGPIARDHPQRNALAAARLRATRLRAIGDGAGRELLVRAFGIEDADPELERLCNLLAIDSAAYARETPMFMTRDQVRALAADGFTVGAHGRKHRSFERLSADEVEREIVACCEAVAVITGQTRVPFAFPYSGLGIDRSLLSAIVERNPIVELVFDSGCLRTDRAFIVNRVFTDDPARTMESSAHSNVPKSLRDAWSAPSAWF